MKILRFLAVPCLLAAVPLFNGCEVDSATDVQRDVGVDFTGFYTRTGESNAVANVVNGNSGGAITSFDLRQGGDRLEAIDNHGIIFRGSIGAFDGSVASFSLEGRTTGGNKATISGTLTASGGTSSNSAGATQGTMQGTWVEDSLFGTVRAEASIPGVVSRGGGGGGGGGSSFQITASATTVAVFGSITVSSSGGSGTTTWIAQNGRGHFSSSTGNSVTYTRDAAGTEIITGTDGVGHTDSLTIN